MMARLFILLSCGLCSAACKNTSLYTSPTIINPQNKIILKPGSPNKSTPITAKCARNVHRQKLKENSSFSLAATIIGRRSPSTNGAMRISSITRSTDILTSGVTVMSVIKAVRMAAVFSTNSIHTKIPQSVFRYHPCAATCQHPPT